MRVKSEHRNLNFGFGPDPRPFYRRPFYRRLILVAVALLLFTLLWFWVPHGALYWLMLPILAALVWVASHGWRWALVALDDAIHRLQEMDEGGF